MTLEFQPTADSSEVVNIPEYVPNDGELLTDEFTEETQRKYWKSQERYFAMSNSSVIYEGPVSGRGLADWSNYLKDLLKKAGVNPVNEDLANAIEDAKSQITFLRDVEAHAEPA